MAKPKPLGLSLTGRPELWTSLEIDLGDTELYSLRCKYWILDEQELRQKQISDLDRIIDSAAGSQDADSMHRMLENLRYARDELSDEKAATRLAELKARLIDWDMRDLSSGDGKGKLPCTADHVEAACKIKPLFDALYRGLLAASGDVKKKP